MDIFEAISRRRSIRRYSGLPVEDEQVNAVFEAVRQSPSWANMQCWRFVAVRDRDVREKLAEYSYMKSFMEAKGYKANPSKKALVEAPVVIVACADPADSGEVRGQDYYLVDMGIACQTLMLAARGLGLGTVFVGIYEEDKVRELLGIPEGVRVAGLIPMGYPLEEKDKGPSRKEVSEILYNEKWG
ncbi:MAG: nitroreductase family protein [Thermodesulfovibrionales bacterium]|nr:nitroreductase family protein [Thermodesulfovibrionales bacterium]